ncbi:MAG TPA: hypothetical protein VMM16_05625 [Verrucomicrobiae bacterium]|nr:hypothetical protein [Verrucomicrobiae bacterium]
MKNPVTLIGAVLVLLGLAALIHPSVKMPAHRTDVETLGHTFEIETQRIVQIPGILSAVVMIAGAGFVLLGTRRP